MSINITTNNNNNTSAGYNNIENLFNWFTLLASSDERQVEDAYYNLKFFLAKPDHLPLLLDEQVYLSFFSNTLLLNKKINFNIIVIVICLKR